jgi:hypothetical protein
MSNPLRTLVLLVTAGALMSALGCDDKAKADAGAKPAAAGAKAGPGAKPADGAAPAAAEAFKPMHTALMDQNFDYVASMMDALIAGDKDIAQQYSERLATMRPKPTGNKPWDEGLLRIPQRAKPVSEAKDFNKIAEAGPVVLTACAQCHSTITGPQPYPPDDPPMPYDVTKKALKKIPARKQLEQHQWANDRLFDGVYYPDPVSWEAGAKAWASSVLVHPEETKKVKKTAKKLIEEAKAIDLLAATDIPSRAAAYGKLLTTCTACHAKLGVKVKPPAPPEPIEAPANK